MKIFDFVIVGNGIMGVSLAYALARAAPGSRIAVVGPRARPGAATATAGAMLNVWAELIPGQFEDAALAERAALGIRALPLWDRLCAELSEFAEAPLRVQWGTDILVDERHHPRDRAAADTIVDALRAWNETYKECMASGVLQVPDGWIDPNRTLRAYDLALDALGVACIDAKAAGLAFDQAARTVLLSDGARLAAASIILANGAFAQPLLDAVPALGREIPRLLYGAGWALDIPGAGAGKRVVRSVDRSPGVSFHLVPNANGLYLGSTSAIALEPDFAPPLSALDALRQAAAAHLGDAAGRGLPRGPGFRPVSADCFPLLGETHVQGIWMANGMKRDGFTCSPFIARELAAALLGASSALPARFQPARRRISYKTSTAAIADSSLSAAEANMLYHRRGLDDFGVHPELVALYTDDAAFAVLTR